MPARKAAGSRNTSWYAKQPIWIATPPAPIDRDQRARLEVGAGRLPNLDVANKPLPVGLLPDFLPGVVRRVTVADAPHLRIIGLLDALRDRPVCRDVGGQLDV